MYLERIHVIPGWETDEEPICTEWWALPSLIQSNAINEQLEKSDNNLPTNRTPPKPLPNPNNRLLQPEHPPTTSNKPQKKQQKASNNKIINKTNIKSHQDNKQPIRWYYIINYVELDLWGRILRIDEESLELNGVEGFWCGEDVWWEWGWLCSGEGWGRADLGQVGGYCWCWVCHRWVEGCCLDYSWQGFCYLVPTLSFLRFFISSFKSEINCTEL